MYKTIIFDLDGTLLYTLEDLRDGVNYALSYCGYPERSLEQIRCFVGNGVRKLIERSVPEKTAVEKADEVFAVFRTYYASHCRVKTRPYHGILDVMKTLKAKGYQMAIVSNKTDEAVKELAEYYFSEYIEVAIGERKDIQRKPAPDSVFEAMRLLGAKKETSVYVGDSEVDRATAKNAGIDCVSVTWGFRDEDMLRDLKPEYLIARPQELIQIVEAK